MMCLINTRPVERAAALNSHFSARGVQVLDLPLLELTALPLDTALRNLFQQMVDAQTIVVVSPSAVEIGMRYLRQTGLSLANLCHLAWIAVGQRTAEVLQDFGIHAEVPVVENSEGMLQLQGLQQPELSCVAVWRGVGGRQFMLKHLQQRGVKVLNFQLYTRQAPSTLFNDWQQLQFTMHHAARSGTTFFMLMTSEASWRNWLSLQGQVQEIEPIVYLVLGQRLAQLIQTYAQQHRLQLKCQILHGLTPNDIEQAMQEGKHK